MPVFEAMNYVFNHFGNVPFGVFNPRLYGDRRLADRATDTVQSCVRFF